MWPPRQIMTGGYEVWTSLQGPVVLLLSHFFAHSPGKQGHESPLGGHTL